MSIEKDSTMVVLPEEEKYETDIYGKGLDTDARGGVNGEANTGLRGLVNRTAFLKKMVSELAMWRDSIDFSLYALKNGSIANIFKVKDGVDTKDAVNVGQLTNAISAIPTTDLSGYSLSHAHPYVNLANVDDRAIADKVVQRDSVGDITTRLFRSEYQTNNTNPALFCIQVQAGPGTNNYIRNVTKQTVANYLAPLVGAPSHGWLKVTTLSGWTGNFYYKKFKDGTIMLTGAPYNNPCSANYIEKHIGTLPVGYRPSTTVYGFAQTNALCLHSRVRIDSSGKIYVQAVGKYYHYITLVFKIG